MRQPVKFGALSLLLTVVVLCLVTLGVLTLATAHSDLALAERYAHSVQSTYETEALAQQWLAQTAQALSTGGALPQGSVREGDVITATIAGSGTRHLLVAVDTSSGTPFTIVQWKLSGSAQRDDTLPNLYQG